MPWLTVERNVSFGLHGEETAGPVAEALARVGLDDFADALPKELSAEWHSEPRLPAPS